MSVGIIQLTPFARFGTVFHRNYLDSPFLRFSLNV
jgi:hypothetical protein